MVLKKLLFIYIKNTCGSKTFKKSKCFTAMGVGFFEFVQGKMHFFDNEEDRIEKYWKPLSIDETIEEADKLFEKEQYMDVYETLNRIKYSDDIEVIWRLARALFNLSLTQHFTHDVKKQMLEEAYEILEQSRQRGKSEANYHKWMAVITNTINGLESLEAKIRGYPEIRDHLTFACDSNPKDFAVHYMLGRWHYEMANLTWLQRKIAKYLFQEPPRSTYQEAYKHLYKAEEMNPRSFLPNIYLLGCACMKLGQYYRAKYYLNLALTLPPHSDSEKCCVTNARKLLEKLEKYDLGLDLLFENYSFGFEN